MLQPTARRPRHRLVLLTSLALAVALIVTAIWIEFDERSTTPDTNHTTAPSGSAPSASVVTNEPAAALQRTSDPTRFARQVAVAVFGWDTRTSTGPVELTEPFMAIADPTGESTAGLASDLTGYLPTVEAWTRLRQYKTRQWLTIASIAIPTRWATAVEQAGDDLLPGTGAFTVRGVRNRAGVWDGEPVTSEHEVAFTVFVVCGPSYPACHLLRLSRLDDPLQ